VSVSIRLATYRPLIYTPAGVKASRDHDLPPYIDASCRREPDLENPHPSISALCRQGSFAPYLNVADTVVYITRLGAYPGPEPDRHWRLTAILHVRKRCDSHVEAAAWYHQHGIPIPSNCMVPGNPPAALSHTGHADKEDASLRPPTATALPLQMAGSYLSRWDKGYADKAARWGAFLICDAEYVDVHTPPTLTRDTMYRIFGRIPATRTPCRISDVELDVLRQLCEVSAVPQSKQ